MKPLDVDSWRVTLSAAVFLICYAITVEGATECFCNREECKETYTCISHVEKCYSKIFTVYGHDNETSEISEDEHGCVDLVNSESRDSTLCDSTGDVVKQLKEREPLIMCCSDNMCNYRKNQNIRVDILNLADDSAHGEKEAIPEEAIEVEEISEAPQNNEDVIFRAAVIAVPIAGGLILVILVLMAVRMLRDDYRRSDSRSGLFKAHHFIEQHFVRKDEKNIYKAKSSHLTKNIQSLADVPPASTHHRTHSSTPKSQYSETNERLIKQEQDVGKMDDRKSHVRVSLLTADKQSNLSIV